MRYCTILLLVIMMAWGCKTTGNKVSLSQGRLVTYTIPYQGWLRAPTRFILAGGQEALYCFSTQTYKRLDVFALAGGKPILTIPLAELLLQESHVDDIAMLSPDSFLALGQYHNNIYLFNSEGKVLQQTHIGDSILGHTNWYTELSSSKDGSFLQDDSTLLLHSSYWERKEDTTLSNEESLLQWYRTNRALPYFLSVRNVFAPRPQLQYALPGIYNHFLPDNGASVERAHYALTPSNVLFYSNYSDSLYVLNKYNYKVEKTIKIQSAYSSISREIETIETMNQNQDSFNLRGGASGLIRKALFDKYRNLYYIAVRHSVPLNTPRPQRRHNRKWSLLVYDKDFNQLEEINIDPKYYPGEMLITREGIMLQLDDLEKPNAPTQFQLFYVHQK